MHFCRLGIMPSPRSPSYPHLTTKNPGGQAASEMQSSPLHGCPLIFASPLASTSATPILVPF